MTEKNDALPKVVITLSSWALVGIGILFAIVFAFDPAIPGVRVVINVITAMLGLILLALVRYGHLRLAAHLIVWCLLAIITVSVWRNGGLLAPNLLIYPVLIVLSGWLLGTRSTQWLSGLITVSLILFFYSDQQGWLPSMPSGHPLTHLFFVIIIFFLTASLTLIARRSYLQQMEMVEQKAMELARKDAELLKLSRAVEQSPDSIMITNLDANIEYVNDAFVMHTGYLREEALGQNPRMLQSGNTPRSVFENLWSTLSQGQPWRGELSNRRKDGSEIIELASIAPIRQADGRITHYVSVEHDITQVKLAEDTIHRLTNFDHLTGLPNRTMLIERLGSALTIAHRQSKFCSLIVFNIDRFKNINDARGHALGDAFLLAMSKRIKNLLHEGDTLARLSTDEFAVLLHEMGVQREQVSGRVMSVVSKIQESLLLPFKFAEGDVLAVTASLGVTLYPERANDTVHDILRRADIALHRAKETGDSRVAFFDAAMTASAEHRFRIERELRYAIPAGELRLFLQPQVDVNRCRVGAEALVHWQHPEHGLLKPDSFVPIAEESDLIVELDAWVLSEVCRLIAGEEGAGMTLNVSVNISPRHFQQRNFVSTVMQILKSTAADPARLTLEITEGLVIEDVNDVIAKMSELAASGIQFSIDDFGTGYSSLAYLKRLPIHELKIDKSFIHDVPGDADDVALVETILAVAKHMQLKVVAEGVETEEQADFLNERGNVVHQGYLFGRPEDALVWIERWRKEL